MKKIVLLIGVFSVFFLQSSMAQKELKLKDGTTVLLNPDSTWSYKPVYDQEIKTATGEVYKIGSNGKWIFVPAAPIAGKMTDTRKTKSYKTVKIGTQTWMAENLAFKTAKGKTWAFNDDEKNVAKYGYLYDYEAALIACPTGYRLPSEEDWNKLFDYLGGPQIAGGKMKVKDGWEEANPNTSNWSGFSIVGAGFKHGEGGGFDNLTTSVAYWSSTPSSDPEKVVGFNFAFHTELAFRNEYKKDMGLSIRCIKK